MKIPVTCDRTERPHGALLQPDIGFRYVMYSIGGRLRSQDASLGGVAVGIPLLTCWNSNLEPLAGQGTVSGGQFDWGGRLPKSNGGAQRFPQSGWKSDEECKGRRELDCERDISSRDESRA